MEQTRGAPEMIGDISEEITLTDEHRARVYAMGEVVQQWQQFMAHADCARNIGSSSKRIEERNLAVVGGAHRLGVESVGSLDDRMPGTRADPGETRRGRHRAEQDP